MKIVWLGQAGFFLEINDKKIIVDPYLSSSVEKINPLNYRRVPVDEDFYKICPDIILLTHNHLDHTDPETLEKYLNKYSYVTVLASKNAWNEARKFGGNHNYVMFNRGTSWTQFGIKFTAVYAEHSDDFAIGVIIDDGNKKYYITGDTLYNEKVLADIKDDIDVLFLPINGVGNNMNMTDAVRFAKMLNAKTVVPMHFGMFDEINPKDFECENKIIPEIYKEIDLKVGEKI